jgi:hypothetical protein
MGRSCPALAEPSLQVAAAGPQPDPDTAEHNVVAAVVGLLACCTGLSAVCGQVLG